MLDVNAKVAHDIFRDHGLAPTFHISQAKELRVNGNYGIKKAITPDSFRVQVVGVDQAQKYAQYTKDVTAWEYKYETAAAKYDGHSTKEAPKAGSERGRTGRRGSGGCACAQYQRGVCGCDGQVQRGA